MDIKKAKGLWQFYEMIIDTNGQPTPSGINDQFTFNLSDELITISLFADHPIPWKAEDDVYLLKSKWDNNTLLYLPPAGEWSPLADFDGEIFFQSDGGNKRVFKKIQENEVISWNMDIIKKGRSPFDYSLTK